MKKSQKGFSLVELLIVIAVIGIIAAIAIPSLIQAQRRSREASAIACIRAYTSAQYAFNATQGGYERYGTTAELALGYMDTAFLTTGVRNSYQFTFALSGTLSEFTCNADPLVVDATVSHYFADTTGVVRSNLGAPADINSQPIG